MAMHKVFKSFYLLLIFWLLLASSCSFFEREYEKLVSGKEEYYTILDPVSLTTAIARGDRENLFTLHAPLNDQSDMWDLPLEKSVQWDQNDYLRVAQALNRYIGNVPLENWTIKMIYLDYECADTTKGFERGLLQFFNVGETNQQETRTVLTLDILPWHKIARRYEAIYAPVLENWETVDLRKIKVSANQAVEIAEKNGGSNARASIGNKCFVNLSILSSGSGYLGWTVKYSSHEDSKSRPREIFKILIDPQDGHFKVTSP